MTAVIVEDEEYCIRDLSYLLQQWSFQNRPLNLYSFTSGEEFLNWYKAGHVPDIVFFDIKLIGIDGLKASQELRKLGYDNAIVFTTNHRDYDYAQQGYEVGGLRYLEKPVRYNDVETCMTLIDHSPVFHYYYKREYHSLPIAEIACFESANHYVAIHKTDGSQVMFKGVLANICKKVPACFVQCHRSFLVNATQIRMIKERKIYLKNDMELRVGRQYFDQVVERFKRYV